MFEGVLSELEVKSMYRELCLKYHPDLHRAEPERMAFYTQKMQEVNAAYRQALEGLGRRRNDEDWEAEASFDEFLRSPAMQQVDEAMKRTMRIMWILGYR